MAKFIEVLKTGLTVRNGVRRSGDRVQVPEDFPLISKKDQTKRWGAPRYREITRADFENVGGKVVNDEAPAEEPAVEVDEAPAEVVTENPFAVFDGLNVEDTLILAADFSDEELAAFVAYEAAGENRKGVLEPLGFGAE